MSLNVFCRGQLEMLSRHFEVVVVSSPGSELEELGKREGVKTIAVPMERHISLWKDLVSLVKMIRVFRKEKPLIVHSMTPKAGLISMLAAFICCVPVRMHTYTGLIFPTATGLKQKMLICIDKLLCFCATYINPEGKGVARDLKMFNITKKPLHIIANGNVRGIDINYWNIDSTSEPKYIKREQGCFTFMFVGRVVGDKGINELISSFRKLQKVHWDIRLILIGPFEKELDPLNVSSQQEIERGDGIFAVGSKKDVRPYYLISDVFVFPSYREGFPNTVLEAGAMGLPSVVTDINGSNEIIIEGKNGLIIPSMDEDALYTAMKYCVENPDEVKKMASHARALVISRYEQKFVWEALLKEYNDLVKCE